jgi:hypothetical protein
MSLCKYNIVDYVIMLLYYYIIINDPSLGPRWALSLGGKECGCTLTAESDQSTWSYAPGLLPARVRGILPSAVSRRQPHSGPTHARRPMKGCGHNNLPGVACTVATHVQLG